MTEYEDNRHMKQTNPSETVFRVSTDSASNTTHRDESNLPLLQLTSSSIARV